MMTDLEINRQLLLAIGHNEWRTSYSLKGDHRTTVFVFHSGYWRNFDYKDWATISPIAEMYNLFPYMHKIDGKPDGLWVVWPDTKEDTPQKAIAMAVIEKLKGKR